jgi:large subunit ribosomal protein L24
MGVEGGIIAKEATIHASNVALYNAETQKADRIGYKFVDGKKVRFFKSTGKVVD